MGDLEHWGGRFYGREAPLKMLPSSVLALPHQMILRILICL